MDTPPDTPPASPLPQYASTLPPGSEEPSRFLRKIQSVPKDYLTKSLEEWEKAKPKIWQKKPFFFYGTLKEPQVLSHVLDKPVSQSSLRTAYIEGYSIEMWGQYKALVTSPQGNIIEGTAYEVQSEEDEEKLTFYETSAYEVASCIIYLPTEREELQPEEVRGKTFRYAGDAQALREGRWDRKLFLKNMQSMRLLNPGDQELRDVAARLTASHAQKMKS
ncbi:MAG: hypothetical protein Q9161_006914 [Pseudevernia consocians]